jgi:hypothetical protein
MTLPAVTPKQQLQEQARANHEAIWAAHLAGEPYLWPGEPEPYKSGVAAAIHGNLHSFWISRGFRMSVRLREDRRIVITLTPTIAKPRRNAPVEPSWRQRERQVA